MKTKRYFGSGVSGNTKKRQQKHVRASAKTRKTRGVIENTKKSLRQRKHEPIIGVNETTKCWKRQR